MGKRTWLNDAIATEYLPFLASLDDNEKGKAKAEQFNQTIRSAWSARGLTELSQQQSLMDLTRKAIKNYLGENHFSLDYIKFTTSEYIQLNDAKQGRVALRNEQVQFLDDPDAIVGKAIALLDSPEWSEIAAGLSVLTGRRSSELLSTAQFKLCSDWSVTFTGALKRRGETQVLSFEIPTLERAEVICKALAKVRASLPDALGMEAQEVNSKYGSAVIRQCDRHFTDLVPNREGKDNLYTHLFRSVYATIATFWFCPPNVNEVEYKAAIQGHYAILDEQNSERKRSLAASRHYSDYEIADEVVFKEGGKRKGVKLKTDGVQVISEFRERLKTKATLPKKKLSSVRINRDDKLLLDEIFKHLELDDSLNQSQKMNELLYWVKSRLAHEPIISSPKPEVSLALITEPQSQSLQGELELETITNDDLEEIRVAGRTVAVSLPDELSSEATPQANQTSSPNSTASGLEAKIDKLVDVMTHFINLQIQGATQPPQIPLKKEKVKPTTQSKSTTVTNNTTQSNQVDEATFNDKADVIPTQRTPRNSPLAQETIDHAINAIIAHNNATELHDLKWAISINAVKELVSDFTKSQRLVDKAIASRQDEIDAHHVHHHLEPNHNHRHKRKRTICQAIPFPSAPTSL